MKIYFDFDRTLFDTKLFIADMYKILKEYNIPINVVDEIRLKNKDNGFNIFSILEEIKDNYPFSTGVYTDLDRFIENDRIYLFDDVEKVLKHLKEHNCHLYLLTRGNTDFQRVKISYTKLTSYFDDIIITNNHKGNLDIDYNAIFIDDSMEEIESILKNNPKKVIYIDRYNKNYLKDKRFLTINSLEEFDDLIKS